MSAIGESPDSFISDLKNLINEHEIPQEIGEMMLSTPYQNFRAIRKRRL